MVSLLHRYGRFLSRHLAHIFNQKERCHYTGGGAPSPAQGPTHIALFSEKLRACNPYMMLSQERITSRLYVSNNSTDDGTNGQRPTTATGRMTRRTDIGRTTTNGRTTRPTDGGTDRGRRRRRRDGHDGTDRQMTMTGRTTGRARRDGRIIINRRLCNCM